MTDVWFVAVAVLFTGYLVLEGFDFGVGMLAPVLGRDEARRHTVLETIGPVWDGNEVWLITAIGAMFAAFPAWYAGLLSTMYLPVLAVLLALIARVCALEWRGKVDEPRWRAVCDAVIGIGSWVPAFGWGLILANLLRGVAVDAGGRVHSDPAALLNGYALVGGAATAALFLLHGATFLALKTGGAVHADAERLAVRLVLPAAILTAAFLGWTHARSGHGMSWLLAVDCVLAIVVAGIAALAGRDGWAFAATTAAVALYSATIFVTLFPNVLPSTVDPAFDLTAAAAASSPYTLRVLAWLAAVGVPVVMLYQGWSYWVFRQRISAEPRSA